jgi:flagellar hook-associated protein 3 FlgL
VLRNIDPSGEQFLADLARIQAAGSRAQRSISSGIRVANPSDAPDSVSDILRLCASIDRNSQITTNLSRVKTEVDTAEQALADAITIVDRARVLASQGAVTTQTAQDRSILSAEVKSLIERLVDASRTMVEGRYIFSGDMDFAPQYSVDFTSPDGVVRLMTTTASRQIEHPQGTTFPVGKTAEEVFDARNPDDSLASGNVFAAVNGLRVALEANDQAGIDAALSALRAAGDHLNIMQSFYGTVQRKIEDAIDAANKLDLRLKTELSSKRDTDLAQAVVDLQKTQTMQQAALQARAAMPNTSLFDYLG